MTWKGRPWLGHYSVKMPSQPKDQSDATFCTLQGAMKRVKELDLRLMQRINLYFCFKLGWSHVDARAALLSVFGQDTLCPSRTSRWYAAFRAGCTNLADLQRAHRRKSSRTPANIQAVKTLTLTSLFPLPTS